MEQGLIEKSPELKREASLFEALLPILGAALMIGIGFGAFKIKIEIMLLLSTALACGVAWNLGLGWKEMHAGMMQSVMKGMPAMLIVVVVGALIASWLACGTIPMIIYHGIGLISPRYFLVTASLATSLVSMLTGTGYGTIGTVGVAFMGIAHGLGIPAGQAAGALVAGAYLGDKLSPFASNANFAVAVARANLFDHIRHCLWTSLPAFAFGLLVYAFAGQSHAENVQASMQSVEALRTALAANFNFSPWLLLPAVLTLGLAIARKPIIPGMLLSVAVAVALAITIQGMPWTKAINCLSLGYAPATGNLMLDKLLAQGGMALMMHVTLVAICAFAFSGVLQKAGLLEPLLKRLHPFTTTVPRLVSCTVGATILVELMTGAAFVCILLPTELLAPAYRRLNLAAKNLTRTIGDCGIVGVPLLPWSIAGVFMSSTLGVPVTSYAPWAVFNYIGILFTLLAGYTGIGIALRKRDDETQSGS